MINLIERREQIVRLAETEGKVDVDSLAKRFNISKVTIRSDLNELGKRGLVVRARGGAVVSTRITRELSVEEKYNENQTIKRKLGKAVAELLDNNIHSLLLDSGTTTEEVARSLIGRSGLTIMTNGLNIAKVLAPGDGLEIMVTGGVLRPTSMSFYGRQAEESLQYMHFDCLVLGVDGFDQSVGVATYFEQEAVLNRMMCKAADRIIAVMDSTKFVRRGPHVICRHTDIDVLVTDTGAPKQAIESLRNSGIEVHLVEI